MSLLKESRFLVAELSECFSPLLEFTRRPADVSFKACITAMTGDRNDELTAMDRYPIKNLIKVTSHLRGCLSGKKFVRALVSLKS